MKTTISRFHLSGLTQTLKRAPELNLASASVQYSPPVVGTSCGWGSTFGCTGCSEQAVKASARTTSARFMAVSSIRRFLDGRLRSIDYARLLEGRLGRGEAGDRHPERRAG